MIARRGEFGWWFPRAALVVCIVGAVYALVVGDVAASAGLGFVIGLAWAAMGLQRVAD